MANFINKLSNYGCIPRELIFDKTLSDRARFVYCYMACKPNGWDFFLEPMAEEIGYSVDTLRKYLKELVASGWIEKGEQERSEGVFGAVVYILKDTKATKITDSGKTRHGKSPTQDKIDYIDNIEEVIKKDKDKSLSKKDAKNKFDVRADLSYVGDSYKDVWNEWLDYKDEIKKQYKTQRGAIMQYHSLLKYADNNSIIATAIVRRSIEQSWDGLFALSDKQKAYFLSEQLFPATPSGNDGMQDGYVNEKGEVWSEQLKKWLK